jgi:hypothetical protein
MSISSAIDLVIQTGGLIVNDVAGVSNGEPYNKTVIAQLNGSAYIGVFNQNGIDTSSNIVFLNDVSGGNIIPPIPTEFPNTVTFDASAVFLETLGVREPQIAVSINGGTDTSGVLIDAGKNYYYFQNQADAIGTESSFKIDVKTNSATPTNITTYCVAAGGSGGASYSVEESGSAAYTAYTGGGGGSGGLSYSIDLPISNTQILTATLDSTSGTAILEYTNGTDTQTISCGMGSSGTAGVNGAAGVGGAGGTVISSGTLTILRGQAGATGINGNRKELGIPEVDANGGYGGTGSPAELIIGNTTILFQQGGESSGPEHIVTAGVLGGGGAGSNVTRVPAGETVWNNQSLGGVAYFIVYFENGSNIIISGNGIVYNNSSSIVTGTYATATTENIEVLINGVPYYIPLFQA